MADDYCTPVDVYNLNPKQYMYCIVHVDCGRLKQPVHALRDIDVDPAKAVAESFCRLDAFDYPCGMMTLYLAPKPDGLQPTMDETFARVGEGLELRSAVLVIVDYGRHRERAMHILQETGHQ